MDKLITGATAYRRKNGQTEWLVVKEDGHGWGLPKGDVRRGESSVSALIRLLKEEAGLRAKILEEAGRATVSTTQNGKRLDQRQIFYLIKQRPGENLASNYVEVRWAPFSQIRRSLALEREKRILRQANGVLKLWRKMKKED